MSTISLCRLGMGRLANHATQRKNNADNREANMKSTSILLDYTDPPVRIAVMKASLGSN